MGNTSTAFGFQDPKTGQVWNQGSMGKLGSVIGRSKLYNSPTANINGTLFNNTGGNWTTSIGTPVSPWNAEVSEGGGGGLLDNLDKYSPTLFGAVGSLMGGPLAGMALGSLSRPVSGQKLTLGDILQSVGGAYLPGTIGNLTGLSGAGTTAGAETGATAGSSAADLGEAASQFGWSDVATGGGMDGLGTWGTAPADWMFSGAPGMADSYDWLSSVSQNVPSGGWEDYVSTMGGTPYEDALGQAANQFGWSDNANPGQDAYTTQNPNYSGPMFQPASTLSSLWNGIKGIGTSLSDLGKGLAPWAAIASMNKGGQQSGGGQQGSINFPSINFPSITQPDIAMGGPTGKGSPFSDTGNTLGSLTASGGYAYGNPGKPLTKLVGQDFKV